MYSSLLIQSVQRDDQSYHVPENEVLERVKQLQVSKPCLNNIPEFYFGPVKVHRDSVSCHIRRLVQRKQAEERISEVSALIAAIDGRTCDQDRITYTEFHKVSLQSLMVTLMVTAPGT
jgi:hypothetical protein